MWGALEWQSAAPLPLLTSMLLVNAFLLVVSIIPLSHTDPTISRNDILQILLLPWMPQARVAALAAAERSTWIWRLQVLGMQQAYRRRGDVMLVPMGMGASYSVLGREVLGARPGERRSLH